MNLLQKIAFSGTRPQNLLGALNISPDNRLKLQADEASKEGYFERAIELYEKALLINPENSSIFLPLAKTYKFNKDYPNAIKYFEKVLKLEPENVENRTLLGECYKNNGQYSKAKLEFETVLGQRPNYDFAKRNSKKRYLNITATKSGRERMAGIGLILTTAQQNLNEAVKLACSFFPRRFFKDMQDIVVSFNKTASMGGRANIAQYEHNKREITVMDDYVYASPVLVASYIVHENIHAKDNDPYTSIREEQDAYRKQCEFWIKHGNGVEDPEMDFVVGLYKKSAEDLDRRVAEVYRLRDKNIPETSYNHPPMNKKIAATVSLSGGAKTLKAYDIIA